MAPKCGQNDAGSAPLKSRRRRDRTLGPSELLQIPLAQDIVQRYVMLKRKKTLESDRTTVYCPRQWCQGPARSKKTEALDRDLDIDTDDEAHAENTGKPHDAPPAPIPPAERLAICTDCTFAFCKVCKASWHGEFLVCDPQRKAKLTAEEQASEEYLRLHTSPCPTCDARCQKTHGCNHMICFKCNTHFCYLCSSWLDNSNPYEHFNNPKKSCYMRLWELEAGDGEGVGQGFAGGFGHHDLGDDEDDEDDIIPGVPFNLFGQDGNEPLAEQDDSDSEDEIDHRPRPQPARNHPNRRPQNILIRLPPARVQAAIARRNADRPDDGEQPVVAPEQRAFQAPGPPLAQVIPPRRMRHFLRRRPIEGIQQALEMIQNDEEDEWDSDELGDEDDAAWQIPVR